MSTSRNGARSNGECDESPSTTNGYVGAMATSKTRATALQPPPGTILPPWFSCSWTPQTSFFPETSTVRSPVLAPFGQAGSTDDFAHSSSVAGSGTTPAWCDLTNATSFLEP